MIISKFYNRMKQSTPATNDPRVLTPNSIPIFILPPTLDKTTSNTPKHELNDDCECWSIPDEEAQPRTYNNDNASLKKSNNNLIGLNQQNSTSSSKLPIDSYDNNNGYNFNSRSLKQLSDKSHNKPKQNIHTTNSANTNNNNNIYKPKIVISSIDNFNELTQTDQSMSSSQQSSRKSKPVIDTNEDRRSSNGKNMFKNTLLNNMQSIIVNDNNDEKLNKEDYCKLWVLHGDSETNSVNNCAGVIANSVSANQLTKVPSLNIELDETENDSKTEEQLQREYLVNLLIQLSNEEEHQLQKNNNSTDNHNQDTENDSSLIKKSKRSKSETFLTQNAILLNNPNISNIMNKYSNNNNNSNNHNNKKTNNNLNIKNSNEALNHNGDRRFSFLNIFSKQPVTISLSHQPDISSHSHNGFLNVDENNTNTYFNDKLRTNSVFDFNNNNTNNNNGSNINNNNTLNPNRLITSVSSNKLLKKINAVTAFKSQNNLNINDNLSPSSKRGSIFGSMKSSNTLTQNNNNTNNNNSTYTFNIDVNDDDDFDKIFNEYLNKNSNHGIKIDNFQIRNQTNNNTNNNNSNKNNNLALLTTQTKPSKNKKIKNIFKFLFGAKSKTKNESNNDFSLNEDNFMSNNENDDYEDDYLMQTNQSSISNETSFFKYDLELIKMNNDSNLFSIDRELVKMKNNFKENEHFFIDLKSILKNNFHSRDKHNSLSSKDKVSIKTNKSNSLNINQFNHVASTSRQKSPRNSITTMASTNKSPLSHVLSNPKRNFVNINVDVSFERLQQLIQGHLISINLKNLKVEPLIEINYVKSRLTYVSIEQLDLDTFMAASASTQNITSLSNRNELSKLACKKELAKITRLKTRKCKFDHNFKCLSKPADFFLKLDHFLNVTEEATNIKLKNVFNKKDSIDNFDNDNNVEMNNNTNDDISSMKGDQAFVFLFTIELHSYLPVSRKTLSSTFRKKKRIFRGQCQIHENFIKSTMFNKKFILHEI